MNLRLKQTETLVLDRKPVAQTNYMKLMVGAYAEGFKVLGNKRESGKQIKLLIALLSYGLFTIFSSDLFSLQFMYLRSNLHWENYQYTTFFTVRSALNTASLIIICPLLSNFTKIPDLLVVISANISFIVMCLMTGLGKDDWIIYLTVIPTMISAIGHPYFQAYISKQVGPEELGRVFQLIFLISNMCRALDSVMFNNLYTAFVNANLNPGFTFVTEGILIILPSLMLLWLYFWSKKFKQNSEENQESRE